MTTALTVGSLFSGIGGLDLGLERAGHSVRWQVEAAPRPASVLRHHWPDVSLYPDVHDVGSDTLEPVDLVCGGFPCQDVSIAGGRAGIDGERSGLWHEFARIVAELAPRWVLVENVVGLLSSGGGRDFGAIVSRLARLGYVGAWRVLDARHFGVAQRRRRVFMLATRDPGGGCPAEILAIPEGVSRVAAPGTEEGSRAPGTIAPRIGGSGVGMSDGDDPVVLSGTQGDLKIVHDLAPTLTSFDDGPIMYWPLNYSTGEYGPVGIAGTLTQGTDRLRRGILVGDIPRRLTPVECERLQGFPDGWTARGRTDSGELVELADTPRYMALGNAVTVPLAEWIGRRIAHAMSREETADA